MLRLYYGDVSALTEGEDFPLSAYRAQRLSRTRGELARQQSLGAERLLYLALRDCAPERVWPPLIREGAQGKPEWEIEGLYFNLSHSGRMAACVIADRPVGLDVQERGPCREALARRFFAPAEQAELAAATDRDGAFVRLWTMKEAWLKASGAGLSVPLGSFSVAADGAELPGAAFWHTEREGFHFALCVPGAVSAEPDLIIKKKLP